MVVTIRAMNDGPTITFVVGVLQAGGFMPVVSGDKVRIDGVGVGLGDHSVDLNIDVLTVDEVRVVHISSVLRSRPGTFEAAVLAATRGNGSCVVPKFEVFEDLSISSSLRFNVMATLNLFADYLSEEELKVMFHLFIKELDAIDNELAELVSEQGNRG